MSCGFYQENKEAHHFVCFPNFFWKEGRGWFLGMPWPKLDARLAMEEGEEMDEG